METCILLSLTNHTANTYEHARDSNESCPVWPKLLREPNGSAVDSAVEAERHSRVDEQPAERGHCWRGEESEGSNQGLLGSTLLPCWGGLVRRGYLHVSGLFLDGAAHVDGQS